jgi:hypothetical protein
MENKRKKIIEIKNGSFSIEEGNHYRDLSYSYPSELYSEFGFYVKDRNSATVNKESFKLFSEYNILSAEKLLDSLSSCEEYFCELLTWTKELHKMNYNAIVLQLSQNSCNIEQKYKGSSYSEGQTYYPCVPRSSGYIHQIYGGNTNYDTGPERNNDGKTIYHPDYDYSEDWR